MAAYFSVPLSSATATLSANTATKAPTTAQASRLLLKLYNSDPDNPVYYGGSTVSVANGIPIAPGGESDWIPCSGDIYVISLAGGYTVRILEGA
jgi:hypothetical protein